MKNIPKIVLLRHGKSLWNERNRFTGWVDVPLSKRGIQEAILAGEKLKKYPIDVVFVSALCRAQMTALIALAEREDDKVPVILGEFNGDSRINQKIYDDQALSQTLPVYTSFNLNERMYGHLQGLDKDLTREKFGSEQVKIWRRSYDIKPPGGESLKCTYQRAVPFFEEVIMAQVRKGSSVLIAAHGNSLRSIIMYIEKLSMDEVVNLEVATGDPICYEYSKQQFIKKGI